MEYSGSIRGINSVSMLLYPHESGNKLGQTGYYRSLTSPHFGGTKAMALTQILQCTSESDFGTTLCKARIETVGVPSSDLNNQNETMHECVCTRKLNSNCPGTLSIMRMGCGACRLSRPGLDASSSSKRVGTAPRLNILDTFPTRLVMVIKN